MTIIRQPSLFSIQELYDMEPTQKYDAIFSAIDMDAIYYEISKKTRLGAMFVTEQVNERKFILT